jgi:hypothetical protein
VPSSFDNFGHSSELVSPFVEPSRGRAAARFEKYRRIPKSRSDFCGTGPDCHSLGGCPRRMRHTAAGCNERAVPHSSWLQRADYFQKQGGFPRAPLRQAHCATSGTTPPGSGQSWSPWSRARSCRKCEGPPPHPTMGPKGERLARRACAPRAPFARHYFVAPSRSRRRRCWSGQRAGAREQIRGDRAAMPPLEQIAPCWRIADRKYRLASRVAATKSASRSFRTYTSI